jgi:hypothetical protein
VNEYPLLNTDRGLGVSPCLRRQFKKAKDITVGETVFDRGQRFIVKEVRVDKEHGLIAFLDTESFWHGPYHPDEYLGVGE